MEKKTGAPAPRPAPSEAEKQEAADEREARKAEQLLRQNGRQRYGEGWEPLLAGNVRALLVDAKEDGATLLLSASEMALLQMLRRYFGDEVMSISYRVQSDVMLCSIRGVDGVTREDVGGSARSGFEPQKTAASDAFRRAARLWGPGAELYDMPKVRVPAEALDTDEKGRFYTNVYMVDALEHDMLGRVAVISLRSRGGKTWTWMRPEE